MERLPANANELVVARFFPMTIKRRGVEMRLVIEGNVATARATDLSLLKAVARALRAAVTPDERLEAGWLADRRAPVKEKRCPR